jgi:hypothetical protein
MEVTFTTSNPDYFLKVKENMNSEGSLTVTDPVVITRISDELWRCEITVSWDIPATKGMAQ